MSAWRWDILGQNAPVTLSCPHIISLVVSRDGLDPLGPQRSLPFSPLFVLVKVTSTSFSRTSRISPPDVCVVAVDLCGCTLGHYVATARSDHGHAGRRGAGPSGHQVQPRPTGKRPSSPETFRCSFLVPDRRRLSTSEISHHGLGLAEDDLLAAESGSKTTWKKNSDLVKINE